MWNLCPTPSPTSSRKFTIRRLARNVKVGVFVAVVRGDYSIGVGLLFFLLYFTAVDLLGLSCFVEL